MIRILALTIASVLVVTRGIGEPESPRAILIEARNLAYDANYRNDQAGLQLAIAALEPLI